jgi:5'-nucleotidase
MEILVSNDDGIYSPGIAVLATVAAEFGHVRVVAPDVERSSMGHAITASRPLSYRQTNVGGMVGYRVNGTPADCVAIGAHHWREADVVLSGVNLGLNLGNSIWHSGTVAAAKQAALLGLRGIALSAPSTLDSDYESLKPWIRRVLQVLLPDSSLTLVNVNIPREPRGMVWAGASIRRYTGQVVPTKDPFGRELFWFGVTAVEEADEGTDRWAVEQGWIALTPLRLDPTDEHRLDGARTRHPLDEALAAVAVPKAPSAEAIQSVREDEDETVVPATVVAVKPQ